MSFASFPTNITTLDALLFEQDSPQEKKPSKPVVGGFSHKAENGFFGVLFGASCSGKSVMSLELACRFVTSNHQDIAVLRSEREKERMQVDDLLKTATSKKSEAKIKELTRRLNGLDNIIQSLTKRESMLPEDDKTWPRFAVLLTQEQPNTIITRAVDGFGFLKPEQIQDSLRGIGPKAEAGRVAVVHMPLEHEKQQAQLIDVFEFINSQFCLCADEKSKAGSMDDPKLRILVVVDNAETIRRESYMQLINRDAATPAATPSESKEFCKMLREYCYRHRLRSWFSFEEDASKSTMDEASQVATAAETYAADATIRLGNSVLKGGFRERTLEIIKARDQYYRRGRHHFTIRGCKTSDKSGPSGTLDPLATGIVIFPSMPTQQHRMSREGGRRKRTHAKARSTLGIPEIDNEVRIANAHNPEPKRTHGGSPPPLSTRLTQELPGYLCPATVSVLVSDLDSVGTDLALHFVAQDNAETQGAGHPWLYISVHHDPHMLRKIANQYEVTKKCVDLIQDRIAYAEQLSGGRCLYFPPEYISESKLLHDIDEQIHLARKPGELPLRVVVDDLFALEKRFPLLRDRNDFVAALFELFRRRDVIALVLDTVEVGEGRNPVEHSVPAGMADHVFLMRHLELQNSTRKVFSILKLAEFIAPPHFWDIYRNGAKEKLEAGIKHFEFFKGLLSGRPEPVKITLSLYADSPDSPQHLNLLRQASILKKTFGLKIDLQACHPEDYAVLQQTIGQTALPVIGDCHIISMDEIWLDELIDQKLIAEFLHGNEVAGPHWDRARYVTVAHDLAVERHPSDDNLRYHYGIPDRHNMGVLCYYPALGQILSRAPLHKKSATPSWEELVNLQTKFIQTCQVLDGFSGVNHPREYDRREPQAKCTLNVPWELGAQKPHGVFTFSMENRECCVSFLLELVLSRIKSANRHLVTAKRKLNFELADCWFEGLKLMFELLDPWDIYRLADCWFRPATQERPCLYSRQWFTSWGALGIRFRGIKVLPLPNGEAHMPTPVSGTWYLGMLKGSSAINAGKALIERLTDPNNEIHRFNHGIAMPVVLNAYANNKSSQQIQVLPFLPYASSIVKATKRLDKVRAGIESARKERVKNGKRPPKNASKMFNAVRTSQCPFHRTTIAEYPVRVSPVLMGLIVKAAQKLTTTNWLTHRDQLFPEDAIRKLLDRTSQELSKGPS